MTFINRGFLG